MSAWVARPRLLGFESAVDASGASAPPSSSRSSTSSNSCSRIRLDLELSQLPGEPRPVDEFAARRRAAAPRPGFDARQPALRATPLLAPDGPCPRAGELEAHPTPPPPRNESLAHPPRQPGDRLGQMEERSEAPALRLLEAAGPSRR